jgi:hypothetical protein
LRKSPAGGSGPSFTYCCPLHDCRGSETLRVWGETETLRVFDKSLEHWARIEIYLAVVSRRNFLGTMAGASLFSCGPSKTPQTKDDGPADYTLTIAVKPIELGSNKIISATTYNGQFPGPLLRFKEGQRVTIDIHNQTNTPEQLHWHGQAVSTDVDGSAEEGTPFIPRMGAAGFRLYLSLRGTGSITATYGRGRI